MKPSLSPIFSLCLVALILAVLAPPVHAQAQTGTPRARDLGVPFRGTPGEHNAITDVGNVAVGHSTIIEGSGPLVRSEGPVRTGVTAILPRGRASQAPVFAGWFNLNGNGEMTGTAWIDEGGTIKTPILITNTHSVGVVRDATIGWMRENDYDFLWALPVVAETYDGTLSDIDGFHVKPRHVNEALDGATGGLVAEGAVGGGTGMICNSFKGGIGTSSRVVSMEVGDYTVGVLVQCNYGRQRRLRIAGVPVGKELLDEGVRARCRVVSDQAPTRSWVEDLPPCDDTQGDSGSGRKSIIIVVATDAPLLPHQLKRLATRATLGLGREGAISSNFSGDLFVAFSTANEGIGGREGTVPVTMIPNTQLDPLFRATVQATEEAITNALVAAETMTGADGIRVRALPHDRLQDILKAHNRLTTPDTNK
jgi:L-aminopeptidase/D-esterase-like protein